MKCIVVTTLGEFEALQERWNHLLSRSASDTVFLTWEWQYAWWRAFGRRDALRIVLVLDDEEELCGIAPLYRSSRYVGPVRFRTLEFIGARHVASEYLDFIADNQRHAAIVATVLNELRRRRDWDLLLGYHTPIESPTFAALNEPGTGIRWAHMLHTESLYVAADNWDTYVAQLGKLTRRNIRYYRKNATSDLGAEVCDTSDRILEELADLTALHQMRMRELGFPGSYASPRFVEFHQHVARLFGKKGVGRMFSLRVDGKIIAANYGFVYKGTFNDYSMGFDPAYRKHSIGFVLFSHMLERCIGDGLAVDFLDPGRYKELWKPQRRLKSSYAVAASPRKLAVYIRAVSARAVVVDTFKRMLPERAALRMETWKDSIVARLSHTRNASSEKGT